MPAYDVSFYVYIDWDNDGFTAGDQVTNVLSCNILLGIDDPRSRVASVGQCTIVLDNADREYTPLYASGPYYGDIRPLLPVRVSVQKAAETAQQVFNGYIGIIEPDSQRYGDRRVTLICYDRLDRLQRTDHLNVPIRENLKANEMLHLIGAYVFRTFAAEGTLEFTEIPNTGDYVNINDTIYTFKDTPAAAYDVQIGATVEACAVNLMAAIHGSEGMSVKYYSGTLRHPDVTVEIDGAELTLTAIARGAWGNSITLTAFSYLRHAYSVTLNTGTLDAGNLAATHDPDGTYYQVGEVTGTPGFDVEFTFLVTGTGLSLWLYGRYQGNVGHTVNVQAYNGSTWDTLSTLVSSTSDALIEYTLDPSHTIGGVVTIRFYHVTAGVATHDLYVDHLYVVEDTTAAAEWATLSANTLMGGTNHTGDSYATGIQTFDLIGDLWHAGETNALDAARDVVESEYGLLWAARNGNLTFKNNQWEFLQANAAGTALSQEHSRVIGRMSIDDIFNQIVVSYRSREYSAVDVIAIGPDAIAIAGLRSGARWNASGLQPSVNMIKLPFKDQGSGERIGAITVLHPEAGTDYTVNTIEDGSGEDYTDDGSITMSMVKNATDVELYINNAALGVLVVRELQLRGYGIDPNNTQQVTREDPTSIALYGRSAPYDVYLPYSIDFVFAETLAEYLIGRFADARFIVERVEYDRPQHDILDEIIAREVGDVITITDDQLAITTAKYWIAGIEYNFERANLINAAFIVRPLADTTFWLLGETGYSELGQTTRLGL